MTAREGLGRIDEYETDERAWQAALSAHEEPSTAIARYRAFREERS